MQTPSRHHLPVTADVLQNAASGAQTNNAEFSYNLTSQGFTLEYQGVQLADLASTPDSGGVLLPILRPYNRSKCACCDLCRAQPNPSVSV